MPRVLIPLTDGFEDIEAVTVIDVLRRGKVEVVTASITDSLEVTSAHGIVMNADALFSDVEGEDYDAIVLPGGPGTPSLGQCEPLVERLRRQREEQKLLCAICAAPIVLNNAGLLVADQHVTCYPTCAMDLDIRRSSAPVIEDRGIITGEAPGSALLFALVILKELVGNMSAQKVARGLVTDVLPEEDNAMFDGGSPNGFGV